MVISLRWDLPRYLSPITGSFAINREFMFGVVQALALFVRGRSVLKFILFFVTTIYLAWNIRSTSSTVHLLQFISANFLGNIGTYIKPYS